MCVFKRQMISDSKYSYYCTIKNPMWYSGSWRE